MTSKSYGELINDPHLHTLYAFACFLIFYFSDFLFEMLFIEENTEVSSDLKSNSDSKFSLSVHFAEFSYVTVN